MEHTGDLESVNRPEKTSLFQSNSVTVNTYGSLTKLTLLSFLYFLINDIFVLINSKIVYGFGNLHDNIWAPSDVPAVLDSSYSSDYKTRGVAEQAPGLSSTWLWHFKTMTSWIPCNIVVVCSLSLRSRGLQKSLLLWLLGLFLKSLAGSLGEWGGHRPHRRNQISTSCFPEMQDHLFTVFFIIYYIV